MTKFTAAICLLMCCIFYAATWVEAGTDDTLETLPKTETAQRKNNPRGAVTTLGTAGLLFASFDRDGDYKIDIDEFTKGRDENFGRADTNGDNKISLIELQDWRGQALGSLDASPSYMAFDRDFDQSVSRPEFDELFGHVYSAADKDENGDVSFSELIRVIEIHDRAPGQSAGKIQENKRGGRGGKGRRFGEIQD